MSALHGNFTVSDQGDVAKWSKAGVCKTSIRRFESARRLHRSSSSGFVVWDFFVI